MRRIVPPAVLALAVSLAYLNTLAPGLTWANGGADGGDLITAAATSGVAHSSGYPTYLALARLFLFLPAGSPAYRANLLSAASAAAAAVVVSGLVMDMHAGRPVVRRTAGLIAGLAFGLSPLLWSQAVIAEVYALHALFIALIVRLLLLEETRDAPTDSPRRAWLDRARGLVFGLAMGNHLTTVLMLPPWLLAGVLRWTPAQARSGDPRLNDESGMTVIGVDWSAALRRLGWLGAGLLIYFSLPLRARAGSPVNWGDPQTWPGFWWLVSGQLYQARVFSLPAAYLWSRAQAWSGLLVDQFGLLGLIVAMAGLFFGRPRLGRVGWITGWTVVAYSAFAVGYASYDSYAYLLPAFLAVALWFGLGAAVVLEALARRAAPLAPMGSVLLVLAVSAHAVASLPAVDASRDGRAEDFGRAVMTAAPPHALVFTQGDEATFSLWYFRFALGQRPDIVVINEALLPYAWYRDSLRRSDSTLSIPDQAPSWRAAVIAANARPACDARPDSPHKLICPALGGALP